MRDPQPRFREAYEPSPTGCWLWTRLLNAGGYGSFELHGVRMNASRASYLLHKGPIPDAHDIDHLCRNRACVNPDHLEAVTRSENLRRGDGNPWKREVETCPQGHAYDEFNTYQDPRGWRGCRICRRESGRAYEKRRAS